MKKEIVHWDMDGVLVIYPEGKEEPENFIDLPPNEEMVQLYHELANDPRYDVYIASTAPWDTPEAWIEKRLWVEKHLGEPAVRRLTLTHNKNLLIGDYLIDDRPNNGAAEFQGKWIQYKKGQMSVEQVKNEINY